MAVSWADRSTGCGCGCLLEQAGCARPLGPPALLESAPSRNLNAFIDASLDRIRGKVCVASSAELALDDDPSAVDWMTKGNGLTWRGHSTAFTVADTCHSEAFRRPDELVEALPYPAGSNPATRVLRRCRSLGPHLGHQPGRELPQLLVAAQLLPAACDACALPRRSTEKRVPLAPAEEPMQERALPTRPQTPTKRECWR